MTKKITRFYLDIYRALVEEEKKPRTTKNFTNRQSLIALLKKELRTYDPEIWEKSDNIYGSLAAIFDITSKVFDDVYSRLAYFLVLSFYKNERLKVNQIYLCLITKALLKSNINPNNYKKYCDILLTDPILRQFSPYDWNIIEYFLMHFVDRVPFELIAFKDIESSHRFLCDMMKKPYSPILYGDFSLQTTFITLANMMKRINSEKITFTSDDFNTIKTLKFFESSMSAEERIEFEKRISKLESECGNDVRTFIDRLLKMITIEKARINGIAIMPKPVKKEE
ncbi:MAG TPA: hypothetical protein DCY94_04720 [Firmicutes bacterium]|nr:hypothetical protein [Bacillota bacterium]